VRTWQSGAFERQRIAKVFRPFTPAHAAESLNSVDLDGLWARGKRLLLLDVDNTLVQWHTDQCSIEVVQWTRNAKAKGFQICIISNTNQLERLAKIAKSIGAETVRGRFKPSRKMFRMALIKFKLNADEAIMIGDQLITDVLGANRSGIEAIWVRRLEGKEFKGTSINRVMERMLTGAIYQALVTPIDETADPGPLELAKPLAQRTIVHQFIKFIIVGGSSFVIDFAFTYLFVNIIPWHGGLMSDTFGTFLLNDFPGIFSFAKGPSQAAAPLLKAVASLFAMTNSFYLNRAWTFEVKGKLERAKQMRRFYVVSILGQVINLGVFAALYNLTGPHHLVVPMVMGAAVAAVWNFVGSRIYAFRGHV